MNKIIRFKHDESFVGNEIQISFHPYLVYFKTFDTVVRKIKIPTIYGKSQEM